MSELPSLKQGGTGGLPRTAKKIVWPIDFNADVGAIALEHNIKACTAALYEPLALERY